MDMQPPSSNTFEQLPLARADMIAAPAGQYRVYSDFKNFKLVEADSAVHALESSGLAKAFKIERALMHNVRLIFPNFGGNGAVASSDAQAPTIN